MADGGRGGARALFGALTAAAKEANRRQKVLYSQAEIAGERTDISPHQKVKGPDVLQEGEQLAGFGAGGLFRQADLAAAGSGEGFWMQGHGLYVNFDNIDVVAKMYANKYSPSFDPGETLPLPGDFAGNPNFGIQGAHQWIDPHTGEINTFKNFGGGKEHGDLGQDTTAVTQVDHDLLYDAAFGMNPNVDPRRAARDLVAFSHIAARQRGLDPWETFTALKDKMHERNMLSKGVTGEPLTLSESIHELRPLSQVWEDPDYDKMLDLDLLDAGFDVEDAPLGHIPFQARMERNPDMFSQDKIGAKTSAFRNDGSLAKIAETHKDLPPRQRMLANRLYNEAFETLSYYAMNSMEDLDSVAGKRSLESVRKLIRWADEEGHDIDPTALYVDEVLSAEGGQNRLANVYLEAMWKGELPEDLMPARIFGDENFQFHVENAEDYTFGVDLAGRPWGNGRGSWTNEPDDDILWNHNEQVEQMAFDRQQDLDDGSDIGVYEDQLPQVEKAMAMIDDIDQETFESLGDRVAELSDTGYVYRAAVPSDDAYPMWNWDATGDDFDGHKMTPEQLKAKGYQSAGQYLEKHPEVAKRLEEDFGITPGAYMDKGWEHIHDRVMAAYHKKSGVDYSELDDTGGIGLRFVENKLEKMDFLATEVLSDFDRNLLPVEEMGYVTGKGREALLGNVPGAELNQQAYLGYLQTATSRYFDNIGVKGHTYHSHSGNKNGVMYSSDVVRGLSRQKGNVTVPMLAAVGAIGYGGAAGFMPMGTNAGMVDANDPSNAAVLQAGPEMMQEVTSPDLADLGWQDYLSAGASIGEGVLRGLGSLVNRGIGSINPTADPEAFEGFAQYWEEGFSPSEGLISVMSTKQAQPVAEWLIDNEIGGQEFEKRLRAEAEKRGDKRGEVRGKLVRDLLFPM